MYDVFLVRPFYDTHLVTPILGIGYISSFLKSKGYKVKLIDGVNLNISNRRIADDIPENSIIGISLLSAYFNEACQLIKMMKAKNCIVITGGPHATCLPEHTLEKSGCDYVIIGEGEYAIFELMQEIKNDNMYPEIKGVYHKKSEKITKAPFIQNLDELPFPDWEQMNPNDIKRAPHGAIVKNFPIGVLTTTRGCPYSCTFCASPVIWDKKIRFRSAKNVLDEIQYLVDKFGVKEIHFEDDNLTLRREHVENICKGIIERRLNISWATPNGIRADKVDKELLSLMKESGCYAVAFGIESANAQILKNVKKSENVEDIRKAVNISHDLKFITQGFFIFGLPGENESTVKETINFAKSLPLDKAQFLILDLLPGTEVWRKYKKDKVNDSDFEHNSYSECNVSVCSLTPERLKKVQSQAFLTFFLSYKRIFKIISLLRPGQIKFILKRIINFI